MVRISDYEFLGFNLYCYISNDFFEILFKFSWFLLVYLKISSCFRYAMVVWHGEVNWLIIGDVWQMQEYKLDHCCCSGGMRVILALVFVISLACCIYFLIWLC